MAEKNIQAPYMLQSSQIHERVQYHTPNPSLTVFSPSQAAYCGCKFLVPVSLNFVSELLHTPHFKNILETQSLIPAFVHPLYGSDLRNTWLWARSVVKAKENLTRKLHFEINSSMRLPGVWMYLVFSVWSVDSMYSLGSSTTLKTQEIQFRNFPRRASRAGRTYRQCMQRIPVPRLRQEEHLKLHLRRWSLRWIDCSNHTPTIC